VLWNRGVHTGGEVTADRPNVIIKKTEKGNVHTDRCESTREEQRDATNQGDKNKIQDIIYRDSGNVEHKLHNNNSK
jgi:hypothetical protein